MPLVLLGRHGLGGALNPQPTAPPATSIDLGTWDIREYCKKANGINADTKYKIPNGYYYAGDLLSGAHFPLTAGQYKGLMFLEPQTMGGAIIDCGPPGTAISGAPGRTANGNFNINYDSSTNLTSGDCTGIVLSGFVVRNGLLQCNAPDCHLWYPEFTFPYAIWSAEPGYPNSNYHRENGGLYHGFGATNCQVFGMNCHDAGTGPTIQQGAQSLTYTGWTATNIDNGGNYTNVHPDSLQMLGGQNSNMTFTDFDINAQGRGFGPNIQNAANNSFTAHDDTNIVMARGWIRNCPGLGLQLNSFNAPSVNPRIISGSFTDLHLWGNGPSPFNIAGYQFAEQIQHNTSFDQVTFDINSYPEPTRINFTTLRCDTNVDASVGGTVQSYYSAWVAANPFANLLTFFAANGYFR